MRNRKLGYRAHPMERATGPRNAKLHAQLEELYGRDLGWWLAVSRCFDLNAYVVHARKRAHYVRSGG